MARQVYVNQRDMEGESRCCVKFNAGSFSTVQFCVRRNGMNERRRIALFAGEKKTGGLDAENRSSTFGCVRQAHGKTSARSLG